MTCHVAALGFCCALLLNGCKDSDYDFDNVDSLLGLGGEELVLPTDNSTKDITLDDFLELNNSNFVHIADNGDYTLSVDDDDIHTASGRVDAVEITNPADRIYGGEIPAVPGDASGTLSSFEYNDRSVSEDIVRLEWVSINAEIRLQINVPNTVNNVRSLKLLMPEYLTISQATIDGNRATFSDNTITLGNLSAGNHLLLADINRITFGEEATERGYARFDATAHTVSLSGNIGAEITLSQDDFTSAGLQQTLAGNPADITGSCVVTDITATSAYGCFAAELDFNQLGSVSLNDVPDFLTDSQVCLDLYDPHINIRFTNELPMSGLVHGSLKAFDDNDRVIASVFVPDFVLPAGESVVSLRKQNVPAGGDTTTVVVPTLSDLVRTIPARIEFADIHAQSDGNQPPAEILMDHNYEATAQYGLECPLQFDDEAVIVYVDSMDEWNDGVKDLSFREIDGRVDGYIQVEAEVENTVPAYFTVTACGMDTEARDISESDLQVTVDKTIAASTDGVTPVTTIVTITMQPMTNSVFARLDGLRFWLRGSAADADGANAVTGKTLNAYQQTLKATRVTVTKHGKVVYDAN